MILLLMRHGIAADAGTGGVRRDADRPLTPAGAKKTERTAAGLARLGLRPDVITTSPLLRARQTAERVAALAGLPAPCVCEALAPGGEPGAFLAWAARRKANDTVLAVGHMPDLAWWASLLLSGTTAAQLTFKKAGVACLVFDGPPAAGTASLLWLMQPAQWRAVTGDPAPRGP